MHRSVSPPPLHARTLRLAPIAGLVFGLVGCATRGHRVPAGVAPERMTARQVTSIAILGSLHVSDSIRTFADSVLTQAVRRSCPSITVIPPDETEALLTARGVVVPRRLTPGFASRARPVLNADLLLAPTVTGLTYDTRSTVAGLLDAIGRPPAYSFEDRAGVAVEGWDLRSAEPAIWVVRTHASENSWTAAPGRLLRNAIGDAVTQIAPSCRGAASVSSER